MGPAAVQIRDGGPATVRGLDLPICMETWPAAGATRLSSHLFELRPALLSPLPIRGFQSDPSVSDGCLALGGSVQGSGMGHRAAHPLDRFPADVNAPTFSCISFPVAHRAPEARDRSEPAG